jgi:hypothetical protein
MNCWLSELALNVAQNMEKQLPVTANTPNEISFLLHRSQRERN